MIAQQESPKVLGAAEGIVLRLSRVNGKLPGSRGHELHQSDRAFGRNGPLFVVGFYFGDAAHEIGIDALFVGSCSE